MDITQVIQRYNSELTPGQAAEAQAALSAGLVAEGLNFGGRPLCNVLRPQLLSEAEYAAIRSGAERVLGAVAKVHAAFGTDMRIPAALALSDLESAALAVPPGYATPTPLARLDSFFDHASGELRFVEFNAETPAGVGYEDVLGRLFMALEPVRRLAARHGLRAVEGRERVLATLLDVAAEAGVPGPHAIGIVDWDDVPTRPEFEIFQRFFEVAGIPAAIGAPDALTYSGGRLRLRDLPITIVYKRVLATEFLETCGLDHPLVTALREGSAVMANPFQCRPLHKKALFAILTDEEFQPLFSSAERQAISAHVPWTRVVADRRTEKDGTRFDLLNWASDNRSNLVLKPNDDYGGRGVVLGWEVDSAAWSAALRQGLTAPMVLQERVATAYEDFPVWDGNRLDVEPRLVDLDPYCYHGRTVHGVLTRLSPGSLLNVTAGAGSVAPTFVLAA